MVGGRALHVSLCLAPAAALGLVAYSARQVDDRFKILDYPTQHAEQIDRYVEIVREARVVRYTNDYDRILSVSHRWIAGTREGRYAELPPLASGDDFGSGAKRQILAAQDTLFEGLAGAAHYYRAQGDYGRSAEAWVTYLELGDCLKRSDLDLLTRLSLRQLSATQRLGEALAKAPPQDRKTLDLRIAAVLKDQPSPKQMAKMAEYDYIVSRSDIVHPEEVGIAPRELRTYLGEVTAMAKTRPKTTSVEANTLLSLLHVAVRHHARLKEELEALVKAP